MNTARLLKHFERISDAADAVPRLRQFILDLAVRGRLVPQNPAEEPAGSQLLRLKAARVVLQAKARGRNKTRPAAEASASTSHCLPSGWTLAPLADVVEVRNGRAYAKNELLDKGTPVLRVGNLFTSRHWYYSTLALEDEKYCNEGDLLYAWSASFGPFIWPGPRAIFHYHIWNLVPHSLSEISKEYLYRFLQTETQKIKAEGHGVSMLHMTKEKMERLLLALPPLAEQHRIVAKVDELMAVCDRVEAAQAEREARRDRVVVASLARVSQPAAADAMSDARAAGFHLDHFSRLTTRPEHVKHLRQTILNLAVRGRLVPQESTEEPAIQQLERLQAARASKEATTRKRKNSSASPTAATTPIAVPQGWSLAPLADLVDVRNGRAYAKNELLEQGTPVLRVGNLFTSQHWYYSDLSLEPEKYCDVGDLLYAWSASFGPFIWPGPRAIFHYHIWNLVPHSPADISTHFLYRFLQNETQRIKREGHGVSMLHMTKEKMERIEVPLPPLAEQRRIVAKVDELMALCDQLETSLASATTGRVRLLESLLHEAVAPVA